MPNVSKAEFARNLGVSKPRVTQYIAHGLPVLPSGKIDLEVGARWVADNFRPSERNAGRGADRAAQLVKLGKPKALKPNPVTDLPLNVLLTLDDVLGTMIRAAGPIAAQMAVAAGAPMRLAYAVGTMTEIELQQVAISIFPEEDRPALDASDWPWAGADVAAEDARWAALAKEAGEPFDDEAWSAFVDGLAWSQPRQ